MAAWGIFGTTVTLTVNEPAVTMKLDEIRKMPRCEFVALWKVSHLRRHSCLDAVCRCLGPEGTLRILRSLYKRQRCVFIYVWSLCGAACGCWRWPETLWRAELAASLDHLVLACL